MTDFNKHKQMLLDFIIENGIIKFEVESTESGYVLLIIGHEKSELPFYGDDSEMDEIFLLAAIADNEIVRP